MLLILKQIVNLFVLIQISGMEQLPLPKLQSKIISGEKNVTTSQSTHSKLIDNQLAQLLQYQFQCKPQLLHLSQLQEPSANARESQEDCETQNRLFTFMDERQVQRKIIQNYIFKNPFKKSPGDSAKKTTKKAKNSSSIIDIIELSRKKRQDFLKKIGNPAALNTDQSNKKNKGLSKSKSPRQLPYVQSNYQSLKPKSKPKSPRLSTTKVNTPRNTTETKHFRAKSSLDKEKYQRKSPCKLFKHKKQLMSNQPTLNQQRQSIQKDKVDGEKELLRKKRQLQKQLQAINESLLFCKKMSGLSNKNKKPKQPVKHHRKKSKVT